MVLKYIRNSSLGTIWFIAVFFLSGLVTNALELLLFLIVSPLSKRIYRIILVKLIYSFLCVLTFCATWWGRMKIKLYSDSETMKNMGKEHAILVSNHRGDLDWMVACLTADEFNVLGGLKCFVKSYVKYFPAIGWSWWFAEFGFLKRNWEEDKKHFMGILESLKSYPRPFWMGIFPEGTRMTPEKFKANQEYALSRGIIPYRHHLNPRTRGLSRTVEAWKDVVPAIYDFTVIFEDESNCTFSSILNGTPITAHIWLKRYPLNSIPTGNSEEISDWCKDRFREKDDLIDYFFENNKTFRGEPYEFQGSRKTVAVVVFWSLMLAVILAYSIKFVILSGSVIWYGVSLVFIVTASFLTKSLLKLTDAKRGSSYGNSSQQHQRSATSKSD